MTDNHIHWSQKQVDAHRAKMGHKPIGQQLLKIPKPKMTKTEAEYERIYLKDLSHRFEGITLRMENGHRYTPDFVVFYGPRIVILHEVKGSYKLHSHGRARLAFDQCKKEFPSFDFVWAQKTKEGWVIT